MVKCSVGECKNDSRKKNKTNSDISFHRFPRDRDIRKRWEIAVNRERDWTATPCSCICSEHFEANDFYLTENGLRKLCVSAVPSINISLCQENKSTISRIELIDTSPTDTPEVIKLKHKVRRLEILALERKRKCDRLNIKMNKMKTIIKQLIKIKKDNSVRK